MLSTAAGVRSAMHDPQAGRLTRTGVLAAVVLLGLSSLDAALALAASPATPAVPLAVTATAAGATAVVGWVPGRATAADRADGFLVQAYDASAGFAGAYEACATCTQLAVAHLAIGHRYSFTVTPHGAAGYGRAAGSPRITVTSDLCSASPACVSVDATRTEGRVDLRAQGFLHSITAATSPGALGPLRTRQWRVGTDGSTARLARAAAPATTLVLSDFWHVATYQPLWGSARSPWSDWTAYRDFVRATVAHQTASLGRGLWWDIQNEPDDRSYYDPLAPPAPGLVLRQFQVAHDAIRSVDPTAHVVGPSLGRFTVSPDPLASAPDLRTFLDFAAARGLRFDAVSWHEINGTPNEYDATPRSALGHVQQVRALVAERPALGNPRVFVNEYDAPWAHLVPGWTAGWIAQLEQAGVDQANRACWPAWDRAGGYSECAAGVLDGLLQRDGATPQAVYWVHRAYALMAGPRAATETTDASLSALGSIDAGGTVRVLIGRHATCTAAVNPTCDPHWGATPAPTTLVVRLRLGGPDRKVGVTIQRIADLPTSAAPPRVLGGGPGTVRGGVATLAVPSFADGDAYIVVVAPTATPPAPLS